MPARLFGLKFFVPKGGPRLDVPLGASVRRPTVKELLEFEYPPESAFSGSALETRSDSETLTTD